ncbi:hypothetical protein KFE25_004248 [Diacronema lutheri]|uniref:Uncharacterized protein n=1 Tax=Diacronema lutheri TaxID=2081491 RepID=A0A8J5XDZ6_DIALT|nr:hypothetical protein KFE25_004248 [Diacronema lutheri]|mmetsp:Transcript_13112/g.41144  ORF Transcript_13112/g.41144 Transcript_13112/m.41144 type:complete len:99 (+) Transcript_13112:3-299(+)
MAQGDKTKALNKNKRAFVKPAKPVRGDQQKLKVGRVFLPTKKIDKLQHAHNEAQHTKKLSKFTEAVFANRVKGASGGGGDLALQYEALAEKTKKKGHK